LTRIEFDGRIAVSADKYQSKQLNSLNGVVANLSFAGHGDRSVAACHVRFPAT